jgi:hypothetical protein
MSKSEIEKFIEKQEAFYAKFIEFHNAVVAFKKKMTYRAYWQLKYSMRQLKVAQYDLWKQTKPTYDTAQELLIERRLKKQEEARIRRLAWEAKRKKGKKNGQHNSTDSSNA